MTVDFVDRVEGVDRLRWGAEAPVAAGRYVHRLNGRLKLQTISRVNGDFFTTVEGHFLPVEEVGGKWLGPLPEENEG